MEREEKEVGGGKVLTEEENHIDKAKVHAAGDEKKIK